MDIVSFKRAGKNRQGFNSKFRVRIPAMAEEIYLYTHPACAKHAMHPGHPEQPARLFAVLDALRDIDSSLMARREAPEIDVNLLLKVHDKQLVEHVMSSFPETGLVDLDSDTALCPDSKEASLRAAGAVVAAVEDVLSGRVARAFCAVRPPGHHAEPGRSMGFCIFNNVALGVAYARQNHDVKRIAVVDFDVHHGNGTQAVFENDPDVFFVSSHEMPQYPGTGHPSKTGVSGNVLNIALSPGTGGQSFRGLYQERVFPALDRFSPDLIFISAGFDAHEADPLAGICLNESDFAWVTAGLVETAKIHCKGRVISTLEGGYNLEALGKSAKSHVEALINN